MSQQNAEAKVPHASKTAKVSAVLSGIAVTMSVFTAMSVYRAEQHRVAYDSLRFVQTIYTEYARERESKPGLVGCMNVLQDTTAITDAELKALFTGPPRRNSSGQFQPLQTFKYDKVRHAGLSLCVDDEKVKEKLKRENLVSEEDNDELRELAVAIDQKLSLGITILDAALIAYRAPVGDKVMICENFGGYLQSGLGNPHVRFGIMGRFIERAKDLGLIREENYPNLVQFTKDISDMTHHFTTGLKCSELTDKYRKATLPEWAIEEMTELFVQMKGRFLH